MANILSRQQWRLQQRWFTPEEARVIAYNQQKRRWTLAGNTFKLNELWQEYSQLWPRERAILRRSQETWHPAYHYEIVDGNVRLRKEYRKKK